MEISVTTKSSQEMLEDSMNAATPEPEATEPEATEPVDQTEEKTEPAAEEEVTEEKDSEEPAEEPDKNSQEKVEPKKNRSERRWDKVLEDRAYYRAKAEELEKRLNSQIGAEQPQKAQRPIDPNTPQRADFDSDESYVEALVEHKNAQRWELQQAQQAQAQALQSYQEKASKAKEEYGDFDDVVAQASDHPLWKSPQFSHVTEAVMSSDYGPDLVYYLASNLDEADKVASMSPTSAVRYLGKIEGWIDQAMSGQTSAKPVVASKAPQPYSTPKGASAPVSKKSIYDKDISQSEFKKLWAAEMAKNKR